MTGWAFGAGVLELPSGRRIRGRALRREIDCEQPDFSVYLGTSNYVRDWPSQVVPWPDFGLPRDRRVLAAAVLMAWERSGFQRVEVACAGGRGRTGTTLACIAIVDGVDPAEAVNFVRTHYQHRAVEMPWQKRFVRRFYIPR